MAVRQLWRELQPLIAALALTLRATQGGRNLARLGLERDIDDAAAIDRFALVPRFDSASGKIGIRS